MTAYYRTILKCDQCGAMYTLPSITAPRPSSATYARCFARGYGWTYEQRRDLCPVCSKQEVSE